MVGSILDPKPASLKPAIRSWHGQGPSHPRRAVSKSGIACRKLALHRIRSLQIGITPMPDVIIVYWRDIPAQIIVGKGRAAAKVKLTERFEQAIDRCAMKIGAKDADAYLAEWRKAEPFAVEGEQMEVAQAQAAQIEATYDTERLKSLIAADGWANA